MGSYSRGARPILTTTAAVCTRATKSESIRHGNYHTVNTGKYTMVPYLGYKVAERILGIS